jgi:hypothetical protein
MSLLDDVSLMITPNGVAENWLFGVLPEATLGVEILSSWTNNDFSSFSSSGSNITQMVSSGSGNNCYSTVNLESGKTYKLEFIVVLPAPTINCQIRTSANTSLTSAQLVTTSLVSGLNEIYFTTDDAYTYIGFYGSAAFADTQITDFTLKEYTASDMDFTRATTATRVNSSGLIEEVPRNLATYSEDFGEWGVSNSPSLTYNIATAPDGTKTADGIQAEDATNYKRIKQVFAVHPNSTNTFSIYVKKETSETNFGGIGMVYQGVNSKTTYGIINAVDGTIVNAGVLTATFNVQDVGTYWRFEMTSTDLFLNTELEVSVYGTLSTNGTSLAQGAGSVRTIWGAQEEIGSQATTYIPTTDRLNVPRIDYTGGGCPHLLVEPERTNYAKYTEDFSNWTLSGTSSSVTTNTTTAPDGTTTADTLKGGSDFGQVQRTYTGTSGTDYTGSIWLKRKTGTGQVYIRVGDNVNTAITITSEWARYEHTDNVSTTTVRIGAKVDVEDDEIYMWGAQLEEGSYKTSYIPALAGSNVTRNAEVFTRTGIGDLINSSEGVLFIEMAALANDGTSRQISLSDGTSDNRVSISFRSASNEVAGQIKSGGSFSMNKSNAMTQTNFNKVAIKWKVDDMAVWLNGSEVQTDLSGAAPIGLDRLTFDRGDGSNDFFGKVRQIQVYKTMLSDSQLGDLTT